MADSDAVPPDKKRQEPPPIEFLKPGEEQPAPQQPQQPSAWVTRPEDYMRPTYTQAPAPQRPTPSGGRMARLAGIALALAGISSIAYLLGTSLTPMSAAQYQNLSNDTSVYAFNQVCGAVVTWAQAIALLTGVMAFQRMNWRFTVSCAFFVMLSLAGIFLLVALGGVVDGFLALSGFLSVLGFVFLFMGRAEFVT